MKIRIIIILLLAIVSGGRAVKAQTLLTESFDGVTFVPVGWTNLLTSGTATWTRVTTGTFPTQAPHSGAGEAKFNSYTAATGVRSLVTPVLNFTAAGTKQVSFWMYRDNGYNATADKIDVLINTTAVIAGSTLLGTINRARGLAPVVGANGWYQYTYTIPGGFNSATNYIFFRGTSAYGNNIYIDDILVVNTPPCVAPANDNCANATSLVVNALPLCGQSTACATVQGGETINQCGALTIDQTVWYKFVATQGNMDVWVDNLVTGSCHLGSIVYNTSACLPGAGNIISCKPNTATGGTDYWHHLMGLTAGNTYLIQIVYSTASCGSGQTFCISVVAPSTAPGYVHSTAGTAGENIGNCMVNTCNAQYCDNGGAGANYADNINAVYRTFCPNAPSQCVTANVNYIDGEENYDMLTIESGPTQNSPIIWSGYKSGNMTLTSTDPSGCLTFRFTSDASVNLPGWNISLSCTACGANSVADNNDCVTATAICSNTSFVGASVGPGILSEGCSGCNTSEHFSNWYYFCAQTTGNLIFSLNPTNGVEDYDFALYGPGVTCGTLGVPIRCSYSGVVSATGLSNTAVDFSEDVSGDSWVAPIFVTAGQCFYLMISQWSAGGAGFTVDFAGSTASLNCAVLPISLTSFMGDCDDGQVSLYWMTASEINNAYFTIEKSSDGINWYFLKTIAGAGNSNEPLNYSTTDESSAKLMYYRLKQTDYDGQEETFSPITIACNSVVDVSIHPNPTSDVLYIEAGDSEIEYQVFDYQGNEISFGDEKIIDLTKFSTGLYLVRIIVDGKVSFYKIVKN